MTSTPLPARSSSLVPSTMVLVLVNLLPLGGVLFFGWTVFEILLLFWAENLVIGAFNLARFWVLFRRRNEISMLFLMPFFCLHYGGFCLGHLVFLLVVFRPEEADAALSLLALLVPLLALLASHAYSFYVNFLGREEHRTVTVEELMTGPYFRVVALHVTIVIGGFIVTLLGEPVLALALLVIMKVGIDVAAHRREHRKRQQQVHPRPEPAPEFPGWDDHP